MVGGSMNKQFPLSKMEYLEAIEYIKIKHSGQFRFSTLAPYWVHPIQTAVLVMKYKKSHSIDELIIAALCHDLVEDTETSLKEIEGRYGLTVASLVAELTSHKGKIEEEGKAVYLKNKMAEMSSWGLVLKLCDRLSNVSDFLYTPSDFTARYKAETEEILNFVEKERELTFTQKAIVYDIRRIISIY